jgi:hypothetical protein
MLSSALKVLTTLLALSLMGNPTPAESCQPVSASCKEDQSQPMDCCGPAQCHCDLSAPSQPVPASIPARAVNFSGHEVGQILSLPPATIFLMTGEPSVHPLAADVNSSQSTTVALYALTHAFLI